MRLPCAISGKRRRPEHLSYVLKGGISWRIFGGSPGSGTGFMINSGIRYGLAKDDIFVRAQQLWTAKAWQRSKRGRYDAAKRTKGRKRHIVVDVLGLILAVAVTGANVQDRDGGQLVLKGLKDRFPRLARVWANGVYAGRLVEWAEKTARVCARYRLQTKGTDWLFRFARALDRGANLRMAGQLPSPRSGLRDSSTHERGLDQNRHDPPYGAKARLSILRQVLSSSHFFQSLPAQD
jgi:hypothetical protein